MPWRTCALQSKYSYIAGVAAMFIIHAKFVILLFNSAASDSFAFSLSKCEIEFYSTLQVESISHLAEVSNATTYLCACVTTRRCRRVALSIERIIITSCKAQSRTGAKERTKKIARFILFICSHS